MALQQLKAKGRNFAPANLQRALQQKVRIGRRGRASRGDITRLIKLFGWQVVLTLYQ